MDTRTALRSDLEDIIRLLADDELGVSRERVGMTRAQIEGVRVDKKFRNKGVGEMLFKHAIVLARIYGCGLVQLTTDKSRVDAHRLG